MRITGLTHLGLGRAEDGQLVPRVLPGEEVEIGPDGAARILQPSPTRVAPPCRHYKSCGGCAMQHATDAFVADWKVGIVTRALHAHGLDAPIEAIDTSPPRSRRRAKLAGRRTKKGVIVGFHGRASDQVVAVPDCLLLTPALMSGLPALEEITALVASRKGEVALTVTESLGGLDVMIGIDRELTPQLRQALPALAEKHRLARLIWNDEPLAMRAPPAHRLGVAQVVPPPGAFLQATAEGEAALRDAVLRITDGAARVADLFAGCGTFALPLAGRSEVHAVESQADMLAALDRGWRETPGLKRVTTETRDLFRRPLEPDELDRFDSVVLDPPRAGAEAQVDRIAASRVARVAMVSCNPVTFGRDAARLVAAGFRLDWIRVVDQFRWSAHVEVVADFIRP
ncbi:MAG: class I SAM-dependent RNA methyltransferase [Limimaricola sp.]|uniref:class I SAM-dependent RNA methyltransferase n=1 Tax=Limimaricola sp. TaxID=2211665 RepID=UPI001DA121CA|nr:class I SAM-dependent RNA methyltransferase [Limimaricola sp.]MBI1417198.1 class I SAM-dependent RNA methyltransferase [Limimaricola sp.]